MEENKRKILYFLEVEITPSNVVVAPFRSLLDNLFFSNPLLLMLLNLISSNTPAPFL